MKKLVLTLSLFFTSKVVHAQGSSMPYIDDHIFNVSVSILIMGFIMAFILSIIKIFLDFKLKSQIMENGIPEDIASTILKDSKPSRSRKWALVFAGIGVAMFIIGITSPIGTHSLGILSFCLAVVFFVDHIISSKKDNNK